MSARDDFPCYTHDTDSDSDMAMIENGILLDVYNEIDRLRLDGGYLDDIARARGEENERLRAAVAAFSRLCGCDSDCEFDGNEIVHRPCCFRWEP